MVFQFSDDNCNVRIINSILRIRIHGPCLILTESSTIENSKEENTLYYSDNRAAKKDLKKLANEMKKFYDKQNDMAPQKQMGFVSDQVGYGDGHDGEDFYDEEDQKR